MFFIQLPEKTVLLYRQIAAAAHQPVEVILSATLIDTAGRLASAVLPYDPPKEGTRKP